MSKNKIITTLGAIIVLIHIFDGFPNAWESFLGIVAGFSIVLLSVWANIDKKLTLKAKARERQTRRITPAESAVPVTDDNTDLLEASRRVTDFYPKTGQKGRRITDIKSSEINEEPSV